jgi:hypothetical protein
MFKINLTNKTRKPKSHQGLSDSMTILKKESNYTKYLINTTRPKILFITDNEFRFFNILDALEINKFENQLNLKNMGVQ